MFCSGTEMSMDCFSEKNDNELILVIIALNYHSLLQKNGIPANFLEYEILNPQFPLQKSGQS